jgi:ribosome-associated protein
VDGLDAMACVKIHRKVGTRGALFALLFGQTKSKLKIPLNAMGVLALCKYYAFKASSLLFRIQKKMNIRETDFSSELRFQTSRSGGAGGQNVNKVSTKVELGFDVAGSQILSEHQKAVISRKLASRINKEGILKIVSQTERSQLSNKQIAIQLFFDLLEKALRPEKKRIKTKPSKASKRRRIEGKKKLSEKKAGRRGEDW